MSDWLSEVTYITRYAGSGIVNSIVGFTVIISATALGFSPIISNVFGYAVGFILGFVLSRKFVFRTNGQYIVESVRYLIAFVFSFLINLLVLRLALIYLNHHTLFSQLAAIASYTVVMYILTRYFVFNARKSEE